MSGASLGVSLRGVGGWVGAWRGEGGILICFSCVFRAISEGFQGAFKDFRVWKVFGGASWGASWRVSWVALGGSKAGKREGGGGGHPEGFFSRFQPLSAVFSNFQPFSAVFSF